jgi:predicted nuclease of restriction endonuclease-like (RecB) superfamily
MAEIGKGYLVILDDLKKKIRKARQKAAIVVNTELLAIYWEIGRTIIHQQQAAGWGKKIVGTLSKDLRVEFTDMKGFSERNLVYMQTFANAWPHFPFAQPVVAELKKTSKGENEFAQPLVAQIPWAHHIIILTKLSSLAERLFYIKKTAENGWSKSILALQIESGLHLRQGNAINNFTATLPKPQSDLARETLKSPYIFEFLGIGGEMHERDLEKALIQHIKKFMLELGKGFAYVGNQYNIKVEEDDYFLDLLFYNYHLHCFVVFELKVGNFKAEYTGKLNLYINTVNNQIKGAEDKPTIGILLCKTPNKTLVKYSLQGVSTPMGIAEYEFTKALPKQLKGEIPTIEELEYELEKEIEELKTPAEKRLDMLKQRLAELNKEELKTPATYQLLCALFDNSIKPLYENLFLRLREINSEFVSFSYSWSAGNTSISSLEDLEMKWREENFLKHNSEFLFFYRFGGLRKSGINSSDIVISLTFRLDVYKYEFILINYNNHQSFIKKLYDQQLSKEDIQQICDTVCDQVMDNIELQLGINAKVTVK